MGICGLWCLAGLVSVGVRSGTLQQEEEVGPDEQDGLLDWAG